MYICICHKINDKTLKETIEKGADNRVALSAALGVGTACGRCMETIDDILETHHQQKGQKKAGAYPAPTLFKPKFSD